jgi:hypothetical protein
MIIIPNGFRKINSIVVNRISKGSIKNKRIKKYNNTTVPNIIKKRSALIIYKKAINNSKKTTESRRFILFTKLNSQVNIVLLLEIR